MCSAVCSVTRTHFLVEKITHESILNTYSNLKIIDSTPCKFKISDIVIISKYRKEISRGYTPNWSNEFFKVIVVKKGNYTTYLLVGEKNRKIE